MRIVSDFRDYYDSMLSMGQDFDLQYVRQHAEIPVDRYPFPTFPTQGIGWWADRAKADFRASSFVIGFCGKIYGGIKLSTPHPDSRDGYKRVLTYCYDIDTIDAFVEKHYTAEQFAEYRKPVRGRTAFRIGREWASRYSRKVFLQFFEDVAAQRDAFLEVFHENLTPVLTAQDEVRGNLPKNDKKSAWIINPCLKDYEFFRLFDHCQAFQEIMMFMANMASPEKPIPHVSDEDLAACKGFNEWSFRKAPGKKKRNRKK